MSSPLTREAIPNLPLQQLIDSLHIDTAQIYINIDKSDFTLQLCAGSIVIKTYPVVFGGNPVDDKRIQGDQCTPEGIFHLRNLYPHAKWSKFMWVDYPTEESWEKFNAAKKAGEIPENATIGGEIGIHGTPNDDSLIDDQVNWTLGCISLKNKHVDEVYEVVRKGTEVRIQR